MQHLFANRKKLIVGIIVGVMVIVIFVWRYIAAVSYTHLDVYKRQAVRLLMAFLLISSGPTTNRRSVILVLTSTGCHVLLSLIHI